MRAPSVLAHRIGATICSALASCRVQPTGFGDSDDFEDYAEALNPDA
jgi:hypothetical protein